MRTTWIRLGLAIVLVFAVGCSDDGTSPTGTTSEASTDGGDGGGGVTDGVVTLTIAGFAFEPATVTLPEGDSLTVRNEDTATHTFTMDDGTIDETLEPGDQVVVTPGAAGGFHCEIHPSMTGTLEIG